MKSLLTTAVCLLTIGLSSNAVQAQDIERPTPSIGSIAGAGIGASPLVRYLAATLHLTQEQTIAVKEAVQTHRRQARTPALLAECLQKVLSPQEFDRYLALQDDAATSKNLRSLALY